MSMFSDLSAVLQPGESVEFRISKDADDCLCVLVQPTLVKPVVDTDAFASLRGALAMPLRLRGTAADLDRSLLSDLVEFGQQRRSVAGKLPALEALGEASKAADRSSTSSGTAAKAGGGDAAGTSPEASADASVGTGDSLF